MHDAPSSTAEERRATPRLGEGGLVVEGLVTTTRHDGSLHLAPMGPITDARFERLLLRPFSDSETCHNLLRTRRGVFHVIDDVELIARAAIGAVKADPPLVSSALAGDLPILADACRWYAFAVESTDDSIERLQLDCRVEASGVLREFLGFNRARHAVLEAAILATRVHILDGDFLQEELAGLAPLVEKTGAAGEHRAFKLVREFIAQALSAKDRLS